MKRCVLFLLLVAACGDRRVTEKKDAEPSDAITDIDQAPGDICGSPFMVVIDNADGSTFCIDRFESATNGELGNADQGSGNATVTTLDGSTSAEAVAGLDMTPATLVSWYQAAAACENAGKRLCTVAEWERSCRGPEGLLYPYGDDIEDHACRGFFDYPERKPEHTGSLASCVSPFGAYDMSGNVEEWTATPVERIPGSGVLDDRAIRGGSFKSNSNALACVGPEFHAAPASTDIDRGFRCCQDGP